MLGLFDYRGFVTQHAHDWPARVRENDVSPEDAIYPAALVLSRSLGSNQNLSVAGLLPDRKSLITVRPFRSPHHTISNANIINWVGSVAR